MSFNLLFALPSGGDAGERVSQPSTLRTAVFVGRAMLGRKGRDVVLRFSESRGGLKKAIPLIKEALKAINPIVLLFTRPLGEREHLEDLACGGCAI